MWRFLPDIWAESVGDGERAICMTNSGTLSVGGVLARARQVSDTRSRAVVVVIIIRTAQGLVRRECWVVSRHAVLLSQLWTVEEKQSSMYCRRYL